MVDFEEWRDAGMRRGGEEPWMEMESRPAAVDGDGEASRATPMGVGMGLATPNGVWVWLPRVGRGSIR